VLNIFCFILAAVPVVPATCVRYLHVMKKLVFQPSLAKAKSQLPANSRPTVATDIALDPERKFCFFIAQQGK